MQPAEGGLQIISGGVCTNLSLYVEFWLFVD